MGGGLARQRPLIPWVQSESRTHCVPLTPPSILQSWAKSPGARSWGQAGPAEARWATGMRDPHAAPEPDGVMVAPPCPPAPMGIADLPPHAAIERRRAALVPIARAPSIIRPSRRRL